MCCRTSDAELNILISLYCVMCSYVAQEAKLTVKKACSHSNPASNSIGRLFFHWQSFL